jgi:ABC-2 type transport system permease protein
VDGRRHVHGGDLGSAASLLATYPDQAAIDSYGAMMSDNPALVAFAGPGYGMDDPNIGVILVNEVQLWGLVTLGLMSVFLVNRHTRAEEDVERADLLRSSVLGRHAVAAATVAVVTAAHVVVAAVCAAGSWPWATRRWGRWPWPSRTWRWGGCSWGSRS